MTEVYMEITGAVATARKVGPLTAGMVGVPVVFSFSPEWQELNLLAVFRAGEEKKDNEIKEGRSVIPSEVLTQPGQMLCIGVEGRSKDGALVIPTVWAEVGRILDGAQAANDPALAPTPTQFERFMEGLEQVDEKLRESLRQAKESGAFNGTSVTHRWEGTTLEVTSASGTSRADLKGEPGYTPVKGVDYFTEAEKQAWENMTADTVRYTAQNLTEVQKSQARENIGVEFGDKVVLEELLPLTDAALDVDPSPANYPETYFPKIDIVVGETYVVHFNGQEYELVAYGDEWAQMIGRMPSQTPFVFGNAKLSSSPDETCLQTIPGIEKVTVSIHRKVPTTEKIDPRFLPEGVPYVEHGEMVEILPETTLTSYSGNPRTFDTPWGITPGKTYAVNFNGAEYKCEAFAYKIPDTSFTVTLLGDCSHSFDVPATGEPFGIMEMDAETGAAMGMPDWRVVVQQHVSTEKYDFTISVAEVSETIHKLPGKFLPEGVPYLEPGEAVEILPACQPTYIAEEESFMITEGAPVLSAGETYIVNWNGTEYTCVGQDFSVMMPGAVYVGNGSILEMTDTGEPFVILSASENGTQMMGAMSFEGITELTLSIKAVRQTVHPVDLRCLPGVLDVTVDVSDMDNMTANKNSEEIWQAVKAGKTVFLYFAGYVCSFIGYVPGRCAVFAYPFLQLTSGEVDGIDSLKGVIVKPDGSVKTET